MEISNPFIDQKLKPVFPVASLVRLTAAELLERIAFYGFRSLLILYLILQFHFPKADSEFYYNLFVSLSFFVSVPAGFISDRWLKPGFSLILAVSMAILGLFVLLIPAQSAGIAGILLISTGTGFFRVNLWARTSHILQNFRHRLDGAYSLLIFTINLGSFLAPLIFSSIGNESELSRIKFGILVSGILYLFAFVILFFDHKSFNINLNTEPVKNKTLSKKSNLLLLASMIILPCFWLTYDFLNEQIMSCSITISPQFSLNVLLGIFILTGPVFTIAWFLTRIQPSVKILFGLATIFAALFVAFKLSPCSPLIYWLLLISESLVTVSSLTIIAVYAPGNYQGLFFGISILSSALVPKLLHFISQGIGNQSLTLILMILTGLFYLTLLFFGYFLPKTDKI